LAYCRPWRWRCCFSPKCQFAFTKPHGVMSKKIEHFVFVHNWLNKNLSISKNILILNIQRGILCQMETTQCWNRKWHLVISGYVSNGLIRVGASHHFTWGWKHVQFAKTNF
jgi:hypothetical protein